jgi:hypothetical protein
MARLAEAGYRCATYPPEGDMRHLALVRAAVSILFATVAGCNDGDIVPRVSSPTPVTGSISVALSGPTAGVSRGQTVSLPVTLTRTNFNGPVDLSVETLPSGVTAMLDATSLANGVTSTSISLTAGPAAAIGSLTVTVHARAVGVYDAVATLILTVTATTRNLSLTFCQSDRPMWLATQDDQGSWVGAGPDADGVYRVAMGKRGGVAALWPDDELSVVYGTVSELATYFQSCRLDVRGAKTVYGSASGS